jgi:hypothetical protein
MFVGCWQAPICAFPAGSLASTQHAITTSTYDRTISTPTDSTYVVDANDTARLFRHQPSWLLRDIFQDLGAAQRAQCRYF